MTYIIDSNLNKMNLFRLRSYVLLLPDLCFTFNNYCVNIMLSMLMRAHILVSGHVQGVFFRDHTKRWAISLDLTGWVKNLPSSQVEILVEGDDKKIRGLIGKVDQGPPMARVETAVIDWEEYVGEFNDFRISW